jgi:hypothetical protein
MQIERTTPTVERDWVAEFERTYAGTPSAVQEQCTASFSALNIRRGWIHTASSR